MNHRERLFAVLHYEPYDRLPILHFGWWDETIEKWRDEGHISRVLAEEYFEDVKNGRGDGGAADRKLTEHMGFDYNYFSVFFTNAGMSMIYPKFEEKTIRTLEDGYEHRLNSDGVVLLHKKDTQGIPAEIDHTLKDRASWEAYYKHRLVWSDDRLDSQRIAQLLREQKTREYPLGLYCGSVFGQIRDWLGIEGLSYLYVDDEALYKEIVSTVGELQYKMVEAVLDTGLEFDFGHFWEDIAYNNGPLVSPVMFDEIAGPIYEKITMLLHSRGIDICSLDCDGVPDALIPTWIAGGVNTMFPIEVGTWKGSIEPWRKTFGRELRGVGGMEKYVLAQDKDAVDREIERLKPLVELGGYIPCIDHRFPPDTKWELVQYYAEKMHHAFG